MNFLNCSYSSHLEAIYSTPNYRAGHVVTLVHLNFQGLQEENNKFSN